MVQTDPYYCLAQKRAKKIKKLENEIKKLRQHIDKCMIYRMSALGCMCGLIKKK